jgi:hypothetical protein
MAAIWAVTRYLTLEASAGRNLKIALAALDGTLAAEIPVLIRLNRDAELVSEALQIAHT